MSNTELENSLGVLKILSEALTVPRSMDEGLEHITRLTCELMETGQAVFLFRDEAAYITRQVISVNGGLF